MTKTARRRFVRRWRWINICYPSTTAQQIEGMIYCAIKKVKSNKVQKQGDTITVIYDTDLAENAK